MSDRIEDIVANPRNYFTRPFEVVDSTELTLKDKRRILESWELDARQLSEGAGENMTGGEETDLRDVSKALLQLKSAEDTTGDAGRPRGDHSNAARIPRATTRIPRSTTVSQRITFRSPAPSAGFTATLGGAIGAGAGLAMVTAAGAPVVATVLQTTLIGALVGGISSVFLRSATR